MRFGIAIWQVVFCLVPLACGQMSPDPLASQQQPILFGQPDSASAHQAVVALVFSQCPKTPFCSGTLIHRKWVLSAAHCTHNLFAWQIQVYFGDDPTSGEGDLVPVVQLVTYPEWERQRFFGDISLIRLFGQAPEAVQPIAPLPAALALGVDDIGVSVDFSGFGLDENGQVGRKLRIRNEIASVCPGPQDCRLNSDQIVANSFAYQQEQGGPCAGDSGGPALLMRDDKEYVAGVTAYGDSNCVRFGVSTDVSAYSDWVAEITGVQAEDCANGLDDDDDSAIDCEDDDCAQQAVCLDVRESCTNGIDDDGDLAIDCDDSDCLRSIICFISAHEICDNGIDDDKDGDVDCDDADCHGHLSCPAGHEQCDNGFDDDGDRKIDCNDSECFMHPSCVHDAVEVCDNGVDDDADGLIDCDDHQDCDSFRFCQPKTGCSQTGRQTSPVWTFLLLWLVFRKTSRSKLV